MTIRSRLLLLLLPPLAAFFLLASLFFYFNWSREILLIGSCFILLLVIGIVFIMADRISKPVRQLNQAALGIAAGDYESNIQVKEGPKEIIELAHTLNTMSQCLVEHMSRLRESSLIRERMYGEYECALLLQHYMLEKVIAAFHHPHLSMRLISVPISTFQKGLFLTIDSLNTPNFTFTLFEAQEPGFPGLFQLNKYPHLPKEERKNKSFIECQLIDQYRILRYDAHQLYPPLVWSIHHQQFKIADDHRIALENRDMIFFHNSSLIEHFESKQAIEKWFARVLRHFAEDGLEAIQVMLTNELTFLTKKQNAKHNFKIICLQVKLT